MDGGGFNRWWKPEQITDWKTKVQTKASPGKISNTAAAKEGWGIYMHSTAKIP